MKLILVLLACAAVTNAYSYIYWCAHNFNIYPSSYCLHYNVRFNRAWCSSYYYSNILKVYPGKGCGKKGWKEKSVSDITNEMSTLLKSELDKITKKLNDAKTIWLNNVISVHGQFSTEFERYITIYYKALISTPNANKAELIAERNRKIAEYKQKLQDLRNSALAEYSKAITAKINFILQYHQKLVKGATDCLNTRNQKLQEFQKKIVEMSKEKVHKFLVEKLALVAKNVQAYKASLTKLFGTNKNWYQAWKVADVVGQYNSQEKSKVLSEMAKYFLHLLKHYARVYQHYVCSYRCYMATGHFNYYSHHYRSYVSSTPFKSAYGLRRYCLSGFSYKYHGYTYKNLKTCDVNAAVGDIGAVVAQLVKKRDEAVRTRNAAFAEWKKKWARYHGEYVTKYAKILEDRHDWYIRYLHQKYTCNGVVSAVNEAEVKRKCNELRAEAARLVAEYKARFAQKLSEAEKQFNERIAAFKKSVDDLIVKARAAFSACTTKRDAAIACYRKQLQARHQTIRLHLSKRINDAKAAHYARFMKMIEYYHGSSYTSNTKIKYMMSRYNSCLNTKVDAIMNEFDAAGKENIDALVMHYSCHYKCRVSSCYLPSYRCGSYFNWRVHYPTESCYSFQYGLYRSQF